MKRILILVLLLCNSLSAQKDTLYLFIEKPFFSETKSESPKLGFIIQSEDKRFVCDYYEFGVFNLKWSEKEKDVIRVSLNDLRQKVKMDTIPYKTIPSISKNKEWWELHNELSLKKVFLVEKRRNYNDNKDQYFIMPLIYEGTRKNIVPTDLSTKKH